MSKLSVEKCIERAQVGFTERDNNRRMFEDCDDYILPWRNTWNQTSNTTMNAPTKQYDSTAMIAANNFVNTMQSNFTPVFTRWAELRAGPGIPDEEKDKYNKGLAKLTDMIFTYLNASNFATASSEMYYDWGKGTGCLWLHEGDENMPLNFVAAPMSQMGLVEGRFGTVDLRARKWKIKPRLINSTWPNDKVTLPKELEEMIQDKPEQEVELLEVLYYDYEDFIWRYEVIYEKTKSRLLYRTFKEEICFTPRWMKIPGFATGIGPFVMAMADIKTLNKMKEYMLRLAALNIFGVYTVANNGAFNPNSANIAPGAFIPVERNAGPNGPTISSLPRTGDFQAQEFMVQDLQEQIRKVMLDTKLPEQQPTPATAFEIAARIKEFQTDIGSAYGRAMYEFVQPLFKRIIGILSRKGLIELPEGFEIDNFFVQVQVVSPIAKAQGVEDVQTFMQNYAMVAQINPQLALTAYEIEKLPQWLSDKTGSTTELLRPKEEALALQQSIMNMAAQHVAAQQGEMGAQAVGAAPGSPPGVQA